MQYYMAYHESDLKKRLLSPPPCTRASSPKMQWSPFIIWQVYVFFTVWIKGIHAHITPLSFAIYSAVYKLDLPGRYVSNPNEAPKSLICRIFYVKTRFIQIPRLRVGFLLIVWGDWALGVSSGFAQAYYYFSFLRGGSRRLLRRFIIF